MKGEKKNTLIPTIEEHCSEQCLIGLDECVECGACDFCSDGVVLKEEELPFHWQQFIEKTKVST